MTRPTRGPLARLHAAARPPRDQGRPLDHATLTTMSAHFRQDFSRVRVHDDADADSAARALGARAFTIGQDVFFAAGHYRPRSLTGAYWLAHELAHTVQQGRAPVAGPLRRDDSGERAARAASASFLAGTRGPSLARPNAKRAALQLSPLSDNVRATWLATKSKGRVFDLLRAAPQPATAKDPDLGDCLRELFAGQPDDLWLAETIQKHGPEPKWPAGALDERGRRAEAGKWPAEPGRIEGEFEVPGKLPVRAFYFRGLTDRRAMIISGVHGSEVSGVEVVEDLMAALQRPGAPAPYYTLIVVPRLFPDRVKAELDKADKRKPGTNSNEFRESGEKSGGKQIPTNRNFPAVPAGVTPAKARGLAAAATQDAQSPSQPILAQNRILLDLIARFRPERIASVHANRRATGMKRGGPGSGVFVDPAHPTRTTTLPDPRVKDKNADRDHPATAEDRLAAHMARLVVARGGRAGGNFVDTRKGKSWEERPVGQTRYDPAGTLHNTGVSLGGLGPRLGMTVVTVEVPWYEGSASYKAGKQREAREKELSAYAASLEEVFLGSEDEAATAP